MSDQLVVQCMDCGHKEELSEQITPGTIKCHECGGPVTQYVSRILSPEDLAKYGPVNPSKGRKPSFASLASSEEQSRIAKLRYEQEAKEQTKSIEELGTMKNNKITKADYLKLRSMEMSRKEIAKKYGYTLSHLESYWLKNWGIKDPLEEDLAIVEFNNIGKEQPQGLNAINATHQEEIKKIDPPVKFEEKPPIEVRTEMVKEEPAAAALFPGVAPELETIVEDTEKGGVLPLKTADLEVVPTRKPMVQYQPPAVVKEFTRTFTIKTSANRGDVEEELAALLGYVQAMRGDKEFQLELYLGEVKVG